MKKIALLIIDMQKDFCSPTGALFVPGAVEDCERLSKWIVDNKSEISHISCSLDSHHINDIAHPAYWQDKDGNHPAPFTQITSADIESGKWSSVKPQWSLQYLKELENQGEYAHIVWPEHCLIGSENFSLDNKVFESLKTWTRGGKPIKFVVKGECTESEHFGIFESQVPIANIPGTQYNLNLQQALEKHDLIYIAGEARNFCVANSLKQLINKAPQLAKKIIILDDCTSNVPGFDGIDDGIWEKAKAMGVRFSTTDKEVLNKTVQHSFN